MADEALADGVPAVRANVVVCNFSLLAGTAVERLLARVPEWLAPQGHIMVEAVHPRVATGEADYRDGWREGSGEGCGPLFGEAAPWYFRTLDRWLDLLARNDLCLCETREPVATDGRVLSLLLAASIAEVSASKQARCIAAQHYVIVMLSDRFSFASRKPRG